MRKAILALLLILCPTIALGQTTSLTVQVTDLSGQTWNNGTWQAQLIGNGPPFYNSGTTTPVPNQFQSGALSNSGTFTATFTQNAGIAPAQTQWSFQFCSNTSSSLGCYNINYVVTATTNLTVNPPTPVVIAGANARAYADATVVAQQGQTYYNVISLNMRVCQTSVGSPTTPLCTVWVGIGGSGPGGLPRLDQVLNQAGNKLFDQGTGTIGFTDGPGLDLSGETSGLNVPHVNNCLPAAIGLICYDPVGNNYVAYNGVGSVVGLIPFGVQNNHVAGFSVSGGQIQFTDLGPLNATSGNSILNVLLTNVQEGDSICYNASTSQFVNCTEGVPINVQSGASYTIASTDRGTYVDMTNASATTISLPQASSSGLFGANFFTFVKADSAGTVVTPTTSNISFHGRTSATTINMALGEGCSILSDPTANSGNGTYYPRCSPTQDPEGDPMLIPFGVDVNTTGWYSWEIANNTSTGTTLNKAACNDGTGKAIICPHTSSTTNNALGVAVNGDGVAPGNTGSTGICSLGFCKIIMDNTATAGHYAQESPTVDGDFTDVGATQPANSQDFYFIVAGNAGVGTAAVIRMMAPQELTAAQVNGGGKSTILINGAGTKPIDNFIAGTGITLTPVNSGNQTNITVASTASGGITSINTSATGPAVTIQATGSAGVSTSGNTITVSGVNGPPAPNVNAVPTSPSTYVIQNSDNTWRDVFNTSATPNATIAKANTIASSPFVSTRFAATLGTCTNCALTAFAQNAGDTLIISAIAGSISVTISSITDTAGDTFQRMTTPQVDSGNTVTLETWYASSIAAAGSNTVTIHYSGSITGTAIANEYNLVAFDRGSGAVDPVGTAISTTNSVSSVQEVAVGAFHSGNSLGCPSGWTVRGNPNANTFVVCERLVSSASSVTYSYAPSQPAEITLGNWSISSAATFTAGWLAVLENPNGTVPLTVTPTTSTINGASTLSIVPNIWCSPMSDGTNYNAICGFIPSNCSSSASPAVCGNASNGSVALPTGATPTLTVNTTAVTANSQIMLQVDESLGTKLGVTCNTTLSTLANPVVTARTAGTSFTFTMNSTLVTNPACVSYTIIN